MIVLSSIESSYNNIMIATRYGAVAVNISVNCYRHLSSAGRLNIIKIIQIRHLTVAVDIAFCSLLPQTIARFIS